jgi:hypothetical protein
MKDATGAAIWSSKGSTCEPSSTSLVVSSEARICPVAASTPTCNFRQEHGAFGRHAPRPATRRAHRAGGRCCQPAGGRVLWRSGMALEPPKFRPHGSESDDPAPPDLSRGVVSGLAASKPAQWNSPHCPAPMRRRSAACAGSAHVAFPPGRPWTPSSPIIRQASALLSAQPRARRRVAASTANE